MIPSFRNRPQQCFVSYSHTDQVFVTGLVAWLRKAGVSVWLDERHLGAGSLDRLAGSGLTDGRTRQLPWMLRSGLAVEWYQDDLDFLAVVHRIAYQNRRRLLNLEVLG